MNLFEYAYQEEKMSEQKNAPLQMEIYEKRIGALQWNFEELNKALDSTISVYKNLVYTDEQITQAKKDRSKLNDLSKKINARRLELKKEFCEPYDKFAEQVKQITEKIGEASGNIDQQVKAFEQKQKDEKRQRIAEWWQEHGPATRMANISIEQVFDEKFLNKSCRDSDWQKVLSERAIRIDGDLRTISLLKDTDQLNFCVPRYLELLDLGQTLAAWEEEKEKRAKAAALQEQIERQRQEREARRAEEEARRAAYVQSEPEPVPAPQEPVAQPQMEEQIYLRSFYVRGTREQIIGLGNYMKANGIWFKKREVEE